MDKNTTAAVKEKMAALKNAKNSELAKISTELTAARTEKTEQQKALKEATENTNFEEYEKAKAGILRASTKIEMLTARYDQIKNKEFVTEKESDETIDAIKAYENELGKKYNEAIAEPLRILEKLTADYNAAIMDAENTMRIWTSEIHANYRSETTTYRNGTNRSDTPVPVRNLRYEGVGSSNLIGELIKNAIIAGIIKGEK